MRARSLCSARIPCVGQTGPRPKRGLFYAIIVSTANLPVRWQQQLGSWPDLGSGRGRSQARALRYTLQISRRACQACGLSHNRQGNSPPFSWNTVRPRWIGDGRRLAEFNPRFNDLGQGSDNYVCGRRQGTASGRAESRLTVSPPPPQIANGAALGMSPRGSVRGREVTGAGDIQHRMDYTPRVPCGLRWFWSITVYVDPRAGTCASGNGQNRAGWLHAVRLIRLILWVSSSNGVRNKNQPKMTSDGVQATIIPSRNA